MSKKSTREEAIELALASAQQRLRDLDPATVAQRAAAEWHEDKTGGGLEIAFLNQRYWVSFPDAQVRSRTVALRHPDSQICIQSSAGRFAENSKNTAPLHSTEQAGGAPLGRMRGPASGRCRKAADEAGAEPPLVRKVLILHYLIQAQGKELARRWVDFRSLPGGLVYYPVFRGRVIARLVRMFGEQPQALISAAAPLGGRAIAMADVAVEIPAFPRVPVVFALWEASEEFAPEGTIMYDDALPSYLETEDAIIVCEEILGELKSNVQKV